MTREESAAEYWSESCNAIANGNFQGVKLAEAAGKQQLIRKDQFYQALADAMSARMLPDADKELSNSVQALDPTFFSTDICPEYREIDVKYSCVELGFGFSYTKFAYRDYKDSKGVAITLSWLKVKCCVHTVPASTAECERGFSKMNMICTPLRSRLSVSHISALMFVSLLGPPITLFEPMKFVKSGLS